MKTFLEPQAELVPGYRLVRYLGRGGFGEVWETEAPGGIAKAIKIVPLQPHESPHELRELAGLRKMRSLRHPYLLSIERFEIIGNRLLIIMELADSNLADHFDAYLREGARGIPRDELLIYLRESAEVLDLMNQDHGLLHLDIKPENLFLSSGHVKVADFGLVQPRDANLTQGAMAISPPYAAPELFDGRVADTSDQYSLAVTYQELLTGKRPYDASDIRGLMYLHLRGKPDLSALPASERPVLLRALQRDPRKRFGSCREFVDALRRSAVFGTPSVAGRLQSPPAPLADQLAAANITPHVSPRRVSQRAETVGMRAKTRRLTERVAPGPPREADSFTDTFVAFLPMEIFAHKLRGFLDSLEGEVVHLDADRTVLRFAWRGWFGWGPRRGLFLMLDTCACNEQDGYRVVQTKVWSTDPRIQGRDLDRRALLLVQYLKSFLMAVERLEPLRDERAMRAEILS